MFRIIALSGILFLSGAVCSADLPRIAAGTNGHTIQVDGKIRETAWDKVPWQGGFSRLDGKGKAEQDTKFKVLCGRDGIYFAFRAMDAEVKSSKTEHDGTIWMDDCVEIFLAPVEMISPDHNIREYLHFAFNPSGSRFEQRVLAGAGDVQWNCNWKAAAAHTADGFDAEVFIPFYAFDLSSDSRTWRFNIGREDHNPSRKKFTVSAFAPTNSFSNMDRFAYLDNVQSNHARYLVRIDKINFTTDSRAGKTVPVVKGTLKALPQRSLSIRIAAKKEGKLTGFNSIDVKVPESGSFEFSLPVSAKGSGNYRLILMAAEPEGTVFYEEKHVELSLVPFDLKLVNPFYRNTIYADQQERDLVFDIILRGSPPALLTAEIADMNGKVFKHTELKVSKSSSQFRIHTGGWLPGSYILKLTDTGKNSGTLKVSFRLASHPASGDVIRLDANGNVLINGRRFFPRGFIGGGKHSFPALRKGKFNIIQVYTLHLAETEKIIEFLDQALDNGLRVIFSPFHKIRCGFFGFNENGKLSPRLSEKGRQRMEQLVNAVKMHPALFGYYLYDEPRGAEYCTELKQIYHRLSELDPNHPVIGLDNTAGGSINLKGHCDIHVLDLYPSPTKENTFSKPPASVCRNIQTMTEKLDTDGRWYAPQAFDRNSFTKTDTLHRAMTYAETRCTVFGAIAAGANGILPYKIGDPSVRYFQKHPNSGIYASPEMKIGWLEGLGPELAALANVLTAEPFAVRFHPSGLCVTGRRYHGKNFVIAVNPTSEIVRGSLHWPSGASSARVLGETRSVEIRKGTILDTFAPYAVHIYTDDSVFSTGVEIPATEDKIKKELAGHD